MTSNTVSLKKESLKTESSTVKASTNSPLPSQEYPTTGRYDKDVSFVSNLPSLDKYQIGHIRHIENLAHQLDNEWAHMGIRYPFQEGFESLRYQLAYMAYAIGLAHFNRLPAAPGYFRSTFDRLIQKMLLPDVWYYWRETSRGGGAANYDAPMSEGWIDPVLKDNIMYSAYVQSMSVMYNFLFNDDKYTKPGALTFKFNPILFAWDTREDFVYDQNSLNDHIYWRMVESGYLGIACEPYCVFLICNQPAILAFRLHDILHGTSRAQEVTEGYLAAWKDFGFTDANGFFNTYVKSHINEVQPNIYGPWSDGWLGALLNTWQPELVRKQYHRVIDKWTLELDDGSAYVPPKIMKDDSDADISVGSALDFGWVCMWTSEMGDNERLARYFKYADTYLNPTWEKGGYFYPRNDQLEDDNGNMILTSPCAGNSLLPYARLNVEDGLWAMYNKPWDKSHFAEPLLDRISDNIDVSRAKYFAEHKKLVFSLQARKDRRGDATIEIANAYADGRNTGILTRNGTVIASFKESTITTNSSDLGLSQQDDRLRLTFAPNEHSDFVMSWY